MSNTRSRCEYCFEVLDPEDEKMSLRTFVKCSQCGSAYHATCWQIGGYCLRCKNDGAKATQISPPPPLQIVTKTRSIPIKPTKIIYTHEKSSSRYRMLWVRGGMTAFVCVLGILVSIALFRNPKGGELINSTEENEPGISAFYNTPTSTHPASTHSTTPTHPTQTRISIVLPSATSSILFADNFSSQRNNWELDSVDDAAYEISGGKLYLTIDTGQDEITTWVSPQGKFSDFTLEVDTLYQHGLSNHEYGVLIRKVNDDNFYQFILSNEAFSIWKYLDGEWIRLRNWEDSLAINKPGKTNHLKIVADGNKFEFFSNGKLLAALTDNSFAVGDIGLMVAVYDPGKARVAFDNLVIYGEKSPVSQKPTSTPHSISTPKPQLTDTVPTSQPLPNTPTLQPLVVSVSCSKEPQGEFANLWQAYKNELGCPMDIEPLYGKFAEMPFERGHLFWLGDIDKYGEIRLVIATFGGQDEGNTGTWLVHQENWNGEGICGGIPAPPEGLHLPDRGLAKVWCEIDGINRLGYAMVPKEFVPNRGISAIQNFEKAVILRDSDGYSKRLVYILLRQPETYTRMRY